MKLKFLLSLFIYISLSSFAQKGNKAFAIMGSGNGDFLWMNIRQIDLSTGNVTKNIFENGITGFEMRNALTGEEMLLKDELNARQTTLPQYPTATMVAAAAYDQKHDKLFFTPMFLNELRWADLSARGDRPKFYTLHSQILNLEKVTDEANNFTRMTIAADGNGYMLNNDGNHLIKFTTGKKIIITELGSLTDASSNNHISVHNKCSSWGGDMVADALGNLYLFTANKNVFKINIETKIATHIGSITGLSGVYTLNGAAVDNDDNVIVSSANSLEGYYRVNMKDLSATKLNTTGKIYNASDLASGNLLFQKEADQARKRSSLLVGPVFEIHCNAVGKATTDFSCHMCGYQGVGSVFMLLLVAHMSHDPHPEILI